MFDDDEKLSLKYVINLDELIVSLTVAQKKLCDDRDCVIFLRFADFNRNTLKSVPQLCNHSWVVAAFEDSIVRFSRLIGLLEFVSANAGAIGFRRSLLRIFE